MARRAEKQQAYWIDFLSNYASRSACAAIIAVMKARDWHTCPVGSFHLVHVKTILRFKRKGVMPDNGSLAILCELGINFYAALLRKRVDKARNVLQRIRDWTYQEESEAA